MIIKGIMTADAAEKAVKAGADAIIVSNHGGRVLSDTQERRRFYRRSWKL